MRDRYIRHEMGMNLDSLAAAYLRHGNDRLAQSAFGKVQELIRTDPEQAWQFTLCAIAQSKDERDLAYVAAGVLEDLMKIHGLAFIDRIEDESRRNDKMLRALSGVWMNDKDKIYPRWHEIMKKHGFASGKRKRL